MVQGYYTLDEAARILGVPSDQLSQMAQKREVRAFADRGTWRFRTQDIEEMARRMGRGSSPDLQLGEASKGPATPAGPRTPKAPGAPPRSGPRPSGPASPRPAAPRDSGVFEFDLGGEHVDIGEDIIIDSTSSRRSGRKSSGRMSPSPKPGSDSDVHLVPDQAADVRSTGDSDVKLEDAGSAVRPSNRKGPSTPSRAGSGPRKRASTPGPVMDSGVRLVGMDDENAAPPQPPKSLADSDIRLDPHQGRRPGSGPRAGDSLATEEIDLDAELRRAEEAARTRQPSSKVKPRSQVRGPEAQTTSHLDLPPAGPPTPDEEVSLGEPVTAGTGDSGINLSAPADSGINLEKAPAAPSDRVEFELSLDDVAPGRTSTPKPGAHTGAAAAEDSSSSSEFELTLDDQAAPGAPAAAGEDSSSSSSSEFELSLEPEQQVAAQEDSSSSEFELTLDEGGGGLAPVEESGVKGQEEIFETNFNVPDEEPAGESDAALESSDFELNVGDDDEHVLTLDEEEAEEGADTVARGGLVDEEEMDDDLAYAPAVAAPAPWGILPLVFLIPGVLIMFVVTLMSLELVGSMWGYHSPSGVSGSLTKSVAKMFGQEVK